MPTESPAMTLPAISVVTLCAADWIIAPRILEHMNSGGAGQCARFDVERRYCDAHQRHPDTQMQYLRPSLSAK